MGQQMDRKDFFSSLFFILLSLYVIWESINLGFGSFAKPGPGFFSFLLGLSLGIFTLSVFPAILLLKKGISQKTEKENIPWKPLLFTFSSLIGFTFLLNTVGFTLDTFLFLLLLLRTVGKKSWSVSVLTSFSITFCTYLLFGWFLQTQLPVGPFGF